MILIKKGKEPPSLTRYRKLPDAYYDGCDKADIRESLLKEQGYLCAYCMRRISLDETRIEHWKPEAELSENEKLDYSNMLAVCYKNSEGLPKKDQTCDARKGQQEIVVDPRQEAHIASIGYQKGTGIIFSENEAIDSDLNERLNLNCREQSLPDNRRAVLQRVIDEMSRRQKTGNWKATDIAKMIKLFSETDEAGRKKEYAGIVLWYLTRKHRGAST